MGRYEIDTNDNRIVQIKVIGVGGGGGNAVDRMVKANIKDVEFVAVNSDKPALGKSSATQKILIGEKATKGMAQAPDLKSALKQLKNQERLLPMFLQVPIWHSSPQVWAAEQAQVPLR